MKKMSASLDKKKEVEKMGNGRALRLMSGLWPRRAQRLITVAPYTSCETSVEENRRISNIE